MIDDGGVVLTRGGFWPEAGCKTGPKIRINSKNLKYGIFTTGLLIFSKIAIIF
jgi:hypothetical protein